MAELLAAFLEFITPKSKAGKIMWAVVVVLVLVVAVIEGLDAAGY
jgi:hypothetical protein